MVEIKTPGEIQAMRASGRVVAQILATVRGQARPGTRLAELDEAARAVLAAAGATSPFLGYRPSFAPVAYPAAICTSVNDAALHGIPDRYRLADGDLLSVDCGAVLDGWAADAAISFTVGSPPPSPPPAASPPRSGPASASPPRPGSPSRSGPASVAADARLIETTEAALRAGIAAAVPGARIGDISAAIGAVGRAGGYGICTDFGGHGVGRAMHEDPHIPNEGRAGRGPKLTPGMVIAIEPWFLAGGRDSYFIDDDGWTIRSGDGSRAAHAEHTVAITPAGPEILTIP